MAFKHAATIPREQVMLLFRHVIIHLCGYLVFTPL